MALSGSDWVQLSRLLDEALDLEPGQRLQWVNSLSLDNGALSETLRDLLLSGRGLETAEFLPDAPALRPPPFAGVESGDVIGQYRLIRELGAGGTATVWLAERADGSLRRQVALKLPRIAWMDDNLAQRLNRERDILASLEHPNIARLYDAGVDEAGRPYLALEYVEGIPLDCHVSEHGLSIAGRLALFLQVGRAVAFAHAHLVVHRDLKPSNILVKPNGEIRLLDFGIARLLQPESLHDLHLTRVGGRAFTPQYAAPEQFTNQPITVSTDVYSLGVVLYWLLAERSPYHLSRKSLAELEEAIVHSDPVPITREMTRERAQRVRGDLEMIVRKAMSKRPSDRYETVNAFMEDIERHQRQMPVRAQPERYTYRVRKFVLRNTLPVIATAIAVVALMLGLSTALWQMQVRQAEAQRAERIKSFIASIFTQAVPRQGKGGVVTASDLLLAANKRVEAELGANRRDKSELQNMIGASFLALDEPVNATPVLRQALDNCAEQGKAADQCKLNAAVLLADSLLRTGDMKPALALLDEHLPADVSPDSSQVATVVAGNRLRGVLLCQLTFHDEGLATLHKAHGMAERMLGPDHEETVSVLAAIAELHRNVQHYGDLLVAAEEAMARATATRSHLRPDVLLAQVERIYADALYAAGRGKEAEPVLRRVLIDQRQLDPSDTSRIADGESVLADVLNAQGRLDEVIPLLQHSIEIDQDYTSGSAPARRRLLMLGAAYAGVRQSDRALEAAERWDEVARSVANESSGYRLRNEMIRAYALLYSGQWREAEAVAASVRARTKDAAQRVETLAIAAASARLQGRPAEAKQFARQIIAAIDQVETTPMKRASYLSEAGASLLAAKQMDLARDTLKRAGAAFAEAGTVASVRKSDYVIAAAQLKMMSQNAEQELQTLADSWQRSNPGSVWHAEALYWLAWEQQLNSKADAHRNREAALRILRQSNVPVLRELATT